MKRSYNITALSFLIAFFFIAASLPTAAELIEPSRTLTGSAEQLGKLSVFSEPPNIEVILDGNKIGQTPIIEKEVETGKHVLKIEDKKTEILVEPGKPLQYSWFKGIFTEIPYQEEKRQPDQASEREQPGKTKKAQQPEEKKEKLEPLYWPLNPKGPIY